MRYLPNHHRSPALFGLAVLALPLLSGCVFGTSRSSFVDDANSACAHSATHIAGLHEPATPLDGIGYAIDLFDQKDKLLTLLNEADLPHADAAALRAGWLRPATRDLDRAADRMAPIRRAAVAGDTHRLDAELDGLRAAGTAGVDDGLLSRYGLTDCLRVFGDTAGGTPGR